MFDSKLVWFRGVLMACGGGLAALLGGWDVLLEVLVTLIVLDYVCGVCEAILKHKLSSEIGFKGIVKKGGYLVLVILAVAFDRAMGLQEPLTRGVIVLFLVANESLSLIEHLAMFGVPIPKFLIERLQKLRDAEEGGGVAPQPPVPPAPTQGA